jgi:hypothetical protein
MSRFDQCEACNRDKPAGNLHCFVCGFSATPPEAKPGAILIQLYPAPTQAEAFTFYREEAKRLAGAGWYPIAHSWGDDRPGLGFAAVFGYTAESAGWGTLLVTYRPDGRA